MNQPREIVDLTPPDPLVLRLRRRARHAQPQHTLHNGALFIIAIGCVAVLFVAVMTGAVTLPGVGR
jgi:hypothetical protein